MKTNKKWFVVISALIVIIGVSGLTLVKKYQSLSRQNDNKQMSTINKEAAMMQNRETITAMSPAGNIDYSGNFLTHATDLSQLDIQNVRTEEGNGALFYVDFLKLDPKKPEDVKKAVNIIGEMSKKKDFSLYPEVIPYPTAVDDFAKPQEFSFQGTASLLTAVVNYANSMPDEQKRMILEQILVVGRQMTLEKDFSTAVPFLIGLRMEDSAIQALVSYYVSNGMNEKADIYTRYLNENQLLKNNLANTLGLVFFVGSKDKARIAEYLRMVDSTTEVVIRSESLIPLMMLAHSTEVDMKAEGALAQKVLRNYSQGDNPVIAHMAKQILATDSVKADEILRKVVQDSQRQ